MEGSNCYGRGELYKGATMAGYTQIEKHLIEWVERKYAARVIAQMNTEWEFKLEAVPEGVSEFEYMRNRIIELHRSINMGVKKETGDIANDEKPKVDL